MAAKYRKVWFCNGFDRTAALVLDSDKACKTPITEISRLFPIWEVPKMRHLMISPEFDTWNECFQFDPSKTRKGAYGTFVRNN